MMLKKHILLNMPVLLFVIAHSLNDTCIYYKQRSSTEQIFLNFYGLDIILYCCI